MAKKIEIPLIPSDFKDNYYASIHNCPLAKAVKRIMKKTNVATGPKWVYVNDKPYEIKDGFYPDDYQFVKEEYEKDPKMKKVQYVVTLIQN